MGCKQSTAVRVQPVGASEMKTTLKKTASETDPIETDIEDGPKSHGRRKKSSKGRRTHGSTGSLSDGHGPDSDRGGSAGSKKSNDSGLGDGELGEENLGFVTEYSDPDKVRAVEDGFKERDDLDLAVTGTMLNTRSSAKDKARLEESMILQRLREEGLISKTTSEKTNSVSFEVVEANSGKKLPSLPPIKLAKLERRRKKKRSLTEEEIRDKLERAEERRKRKEQSRLEKIKEMDRADHTSALSSFQDYVKKKEEQSTQKMESVSDKREKRLAEIKEKQLERERKREEVRRRKRELQLLGNSQTQEATSTGEDVRDMSELMAQDVAQ